MKHDNFKVGEYIKAFDFKPCPDRPDRFRVGQIINVNPEGTAEQPYAHYIIYCVVTHCTAFIPMQISFDEYDKRILLVDNQDMTDYIAQGLKRIRKI